MAPTKGSPFSTPSSTEVGSDGPSEESSSGPFRPKYSFILKRLPAQHLKIALQALADPGFNDHKLGTIHVDERGFEITVHNYRYASACLWIEPTPGMVFHSFKPFPPVCIYLAPIPWGFRDHNEVSVFHEIESDKLWFKFATRQLEVPFRRIENLFDRFPPIYPFCEAVVPAKDLRDMIDLVMMQAQSETSSADKDREVSVDIKDNFAVFEVGRSEKKWEYDYNKIGLIGAMGAKGGQVHRARLNFTYYDFLKIASRLSTCTLRFLHPPTGFIQFAFNTPQVQLMIINEAIKIMPNVDQMTVTYEAAKSKAEMRASSSGATR